MAAILTAIAKKRRKHRKSWIMQTLKQIQGMAIMSVYMLIKGLAIFFFINYGIFIFSLSKNDITDFQLKLRYYSGFMFILFGLSLLFWGR